MSSSPDSRIRRLASGIYAAADVFVFPTLGDTFGMVVSEAMACGLPVIATRAAGEIGDRVEEGVNGFIVPPARQRCAARADELSLAHDQELRRRMGAASAEKVAGQTPELWAQAFEDAIERILSMPRARDARPRARRVRGAVGDNTRERPVRHPLSGLRRAAQPGAPPGARAARRTASS